MAAKQVAAQKSTGSVHIYSTLANPQRFVVYAPPPEVGMLPVVAREVLIKGGAGIASKNLITPIGVHTAITQDEYDAICGLEHFTRFVASGHITVQQKVINDIDRAVSDMNPRDPGGPLTPADYMNEKADGSVPLPVELDKAGTGWVANQLSNR